MSQQQSEESSDNYDLYNQPWNPVSYFEEEHEATGGNASNTAYSPSRLESLFETNQIAVNQDIAIRKRFLTSEVNNEPSCPVSTTSSSEPADLDDLSQYTLEVDDGLKILDTTRVINQKAIFNDLDRLRRLREATGEKPSKDVYINDEETNSSYLLEISDDTSKDSDTTPNLIDLNMDNILLSLPDVNTTTFDNNLIDVDYFGKLNELESQLDGPFSSITSTNQPNLINTNLITTKKASVSDGDADDMIINKIIVSEGINNDFPLDANINDLNRKNSENDVVSAISEENDDKDKSNVNVEDSNNTNLYSELKDVDLQDELDKLLDASDDDDNVEDIEIELPDVPINNEIDNIKTNSDMNEVVNLMSQEIDSQADATTSANVHSEHNIDDKVQESSSIENVSDKIGTKDNSCGASDQNIDQNVDDILLSNETEDVDALINYVDSMSIDESQPSSDTASTTVDAVTEGSEVETVPINNSPSETPISDSQSLNTAEQSASDSDNNEVDSTKSPELAKAENEVSETIPIDTPANEVSEIDLSEATVDSMVVEDSSAVLSRHDSLAIEDILDHIESGEKEVETSAAVETPVEEDSVNNTNSEESVISQSNEIDSESGLAPETSTVVDESDDAVRTTESSDAVADKTEASNESNVSAVSDKSPIPITKTVDVSSVHYKDSIVCLTPDDDEDIMAPSSSGTNANVIPDEEKDDDTISEDAVNMIESSSADHVEQSNDDVGVSAAATTDVGEDNTASEVESTVSDAKVVCQDNNGEEQEVEQEVPAAAESQEPPSTSTPSICEVTEEPESSSPVELSVEPTPSQPDPESIEDDVFDDDLPAGASALGVSAIGACAIGASAAASGTSGSSDGPIMQDSIGSVEPVTRTRPSSSIRRVRFSLDNEELGSERNNGGATSAAAPPGAEVVSAIPETAIPDSIIPDVTEASSNPTLTQEMRTLGWVAPKWIPDSEAKACMACNAKFTVVKRRHHCRACGKVLCSQCCNMKFHLPYTDYKPVRVCQTCCDIMINALNGAAQGEQPQQVNQQQPTSSQAPPPHFNMPEAPPPYSETIEGLPERLGSTSSNAPPYSETAAPRFDEQPAEVMTAGQAIENLPVMRNSPFPIGTINDIMSFQLPGYSSTSSTSSTRRTSRNRSESEMSAVIMFNSTVTNLPPILRRNNEETRIINNPDLDILMKQMNDENEDPIAFIVNKNLVVRVKVVNLDCCVEKNCWCFVSDGMGASNQEEVVILIKCKSYEIEDLQLIRKVLQQMNAIFEKAKHGNAVSDSEQMEFNPNITCMPKNTGMLFYKATVQCVKKLFLPTSPYLFGMYIERSEIPWARNFPLRLLLRIGAEYKYYPCPLFNVLDRPPVYDSVGRTILDLLADFRNFQYTLPRIVGVTINLRGKDTIIKLPRHRFDEVLKTVNASEENVLSLAGNFSPTCDGHLVSVEKDGRYKTQTLSIVLKENRKVTCASFFVMSAALKPDPSGIKAKASIVEDGVMVQVTSEVLQEFKTAIKDMKEYSITAGNPQAEDSSQVSIEWCSADSSDRPKLTSPIDAKSFENLTNMKIRHSYDYTSNNLTAKIHWVEVYFLPQDNDTTVQRLSARELGQMTSSIAKACMSALSPHLMTLIALEMTRIGLRVNLAANFVEYKIGSNLTTLPPELLPTLDDKLVPAVHNVMSSAQERVAVELIFQLVKIV